MANHFVDDSATGGADDGTSWSDAWTSITSVSVSDGDTVYVAAGHEEDLSGTTYIGGSVSDPVNIVSATAGSDPPSYSAGATINNWTSSNLIRPGTGGKVVAWWGLTLAADSGNSQDLKLAMSDDSASYFFGCTLKAMDQVYLNSSNDSYAKYTSCDYEILASATSGSRYFYQTGASATADVRDGSFVNPHQDYAIRKFNGGVTRFRGCDMSDFSVAHNDDSADRSGSVQFSGCEFGAGFAVGAEPYSGKFGSVTVADYCESGTLGVSDAANGFTGVDDYHGRTAFDSSRYRDGGAKDSLTGDNYSHAVTGRYGSLAEGHNSCELVARVEGGSSITVTLHLAGSATLYNDEMWFDLFGPSTTSSPRQHFHTTRKANPTAAQAELTSDTESWTGSDVGTKYKIAYTYTPHHSGLVSIIPVYAKGSGTIFICPALTIE